VEYSGGIGPLLDTTETSGSTWTTATKQDGIRGIDSHGNARVKGDDPIERIAAGQNRENGPPQNYDL
jgi:hypothetical protein